TQSKLYFCSSIHPHPPKSTLFPYTTLFRSASNPERAANFYRKAFGWKIEKWPGPTDYWLVNTGAEGTPGINGGLMKNTEVKTTTDRKSTRLNSSHVEISYAVFCLKKKKNKN